MKDMGIPTRLFELVVGIIFVQSDGDIFPQYFPQIYFDLSTHSAVCT